LVPLWDESGTRVGGVGGQTGRRKDGERGSGKVGKREEGSGKVGKREEGRGKREEGRGKREGIGRRRGWQTERISGQSSRRLSGDRGCRFVLLLY
jgi:hypothetical protein